MAGGPTRFDDIMPLAPTLQEFGVGFVQDEERLSAQKIAPLFVPQVKSRKIKYAVADDANRLRLRDTRVGPYDPETNSRLKKTLVEWEMEERMHSVPLSKTAMPDLSVDDAREEATAQATEVVMLDWERAVRDYFTTAANYPVGNKTTLTTGTYLDAEGVDPIGFFASILTALDLRSKGQYSQLSASPLFWERMASSAFVKDYLTKLQKDYDPAKGGVGQATVDILANKLGFDRGVRLAATYETSNEGAAESRARLWGNFAIAQILEDSPGKNTSIHAVTLSPYDDLFVNYEEEVDMRITKFGCHSLARAIIVNQYAGYLVTAPVTP